MIKKRTISNPCNPMSFIYIYIYISEYILYQNRTMNEEGQLNGIVERVQRGMSTRHWQLYLMAIGILDQTFGCYFRCDWHVLFGKTNSLFFFLLLLPSFSSFLPGQRVSLWESLETNSRFCVCSLHPFLSIGYKTLIAPFSNADVPARCFWNLLTYAYTIDKRVKEDKKNAYTIQE